jgi:hypothetical protein
MCRFALRARSQSLAREFGPKEVHVAHIAIGMSFYLLFFFFSFFYSHRSFVFIVASLTTSRVPTTTSMNADDVATLFLHVHHQARSEWAMELELSPPEQQQQQQQQKFQQ